MTEVNETVIYAKDLVVEYRQGRKVTRALNGVSFEVSKGETVGFIGSNGAGKSTTMKTLMGFIFPTSGELRVFGEPAGTVASRWRIGYLPEVSLYYPFMKARELLELYGGLHGLRRKQLKTRSPELLEKVGLGGRGETLLRHYSKGMQQRLGIAQAIIAEPEALIFDELSSGLDPVGRYDLREVLLELKAKGRTIFFSSHELTEVESLCDRIIVIDQGRILEQRGIRKLLRPLNHFDIQFKLADEKQVKELRRDGYAVVIKGDVYACMVEGSERYAELVRHLSDLGARIVDTQTQNLSLEDYFMNLIRPGIVEDKRIAAAVEEQE